MQTTPTIRYEYRQDGKACVLTFDNQTLAQRQHITARFAVARAKWACTELAKRLDGYRKDRLAAWEQADPSTRGEKPNGVVPPEVRTQLCADIPDQQLEQELVRENGENVLVVLEAMRLIRSHEVEGVAVQDEPEAIRESFSRLHPVLLTEIMVPAFLQIFPALKREASDEEESR